MCLSLHDGGVRAGSEWALPAQRALLVCSRDYRIAPCISEWVLIRRQLKPGLKIGEAPNYAGIPLCATPLMPVGPLRFCVVALEACPTVGRCFCKACAVVTQPSRSSRGNNERCS